MRGSRVRLSLVLLRITARGGHAISMGRECSLSLCLKIVLRMGVVLAVSMARKLRRLLDMDGPLAVRIVLLRLGLDISVPLGLRIALTLGMALASREAWRVSIVLRVGLARYLSKGWSRRLPLVHRSALILRMAVIVIQALIWRKPDVWKCFVLRQYVVLVHDRVLREVPVLRSVFAAM